MLELPLFAHLERRQFALLSHRVDDLVGDLEQLSDLGQRWYFVRHNRTLTVMTIRGCQTLANGATLCSRRSAALAWDETYPCKIEAI